MMQKSAFRVSDALRCMLVNAPRGPNLACPREDLSGSRPLQNALLWKDAVAQPKGRVTLVWWQGIHLGGLVSARARWSPRAWEIDRLYLPGAPADLGLQQPCRDPSWTTVPLDLLERLVQELGWRSAERVFLRVPADSPIIPLAQRSGFFPSFRETLLKRPGDAPACHVSNNGSAPDPVLRERRPQDEHALFQLYSATTPVFVREALGLTFDQWQAARERRCGKGLERVTETDGRVSAWLGLRDYRQEEWAELMVHPRNPELLSPVLSLALARPGQQCWLAPDYQVPLIEQLRYRGFHEVAQYAILCKMVAAPVVCRGMAPVEA